MKISSKPSMTLWTMYSQYNCTEICFVTGGGYFMKNKLSVLVSIFVFIILSYIWVVSIDIVGIQNVNKDVIVTITVGLLLVGLILLIYKSIKRKFKLDYVWVQRSILIAVFDILTVIVAYFFALLIRHDFDFGLIGFKYLSAYLWSIPSMCILTVLVFYACKLYHSIWRFASSIELYRMIKAYLIFIPAFLLIVVAAQVNMPRSYWIIGYVLSFIIHTGLRFSYRFISQFLNYNSQKKIVKRMIKIIVRM